MDHRFSNVLVIAPILKIKELLLMMVMPIDISCIRNKNIF